MASNSIMLEQGRQEQNESRQADAPDKAEGTEMAAQDEIIQGPVGQPLLPPIQAAQSVHDQSQGPMQASSPQQQQQQQQQQQDQQQQQQQQPVQSPTSSQSHYESRPQQSHYAQTPPVQQQQHQQQQPPPSPLPPPPPPQQQQQHQQQAPAAVQYEHAAPTQANGAPPGYAPAQQIPPPHHNPYQYQQPPQYPQAGLNGDANGFPPQMRYSMPLPPNGMNAQQLSGTRHKKEIKRRTKTGCLTCRKRRIKCDEGHPTCRNCQKSKRECLGYDPIFKPQTGQPANIQPQPGSLGSLPPPPDSQSPQAAPPLAPHAHPHSHYSNIPQGYVPASSAGYAPAPAMQNQLDQGYDYGSAIDPALAAVHPAASHIPPPPMPPPQEEYSTILLPERNVRLITMDDAYHLDGIPPSFPPPQDASQPIPQHQLDAVRDLYLREYAPGLDRFFETDWYGSQGLNVLMLDRQLLHYFAHCIERFQHPPSEQNKGLPSIEARLIWLLATMAMDPNQPPLPHLPRIEAVSHIILGTFMPTERVPSAPPPATMPDPKTAPDAYAFYLQDLFWHHLSSFVTIRDDTSRPQTSDQDIANQLAGMRNILSMLENRDVLYSMAIARHFGGRMERYEPEKVLVVRGTEAEDPINKLVVAMGFLANEEVQGTTQVVQRLCGMSRRAFLLQRLDSVAPNGHIQANGVH